jgi:hypothetical protein
VVDGRFEPFPDEECAPYPDGQDDALAQGGVLVMEQLIQVAGAVFVLAGFTAAQVGRLDQHSPVYLGVNLAGSAILAVDAMLGHELGFLLLEGVWAAVSAWGLVQLARRRAPASA